MNKFLISKADSECRFNVLNFLAPYWSEISSEDTEYRITITMESGQFVNLTQSLPEELRFNKGDEIYIFKKDDFWISRRKDKKFSYESYKRIDELFKSLNRTFINVYGLILEYQESSALLTVTDMTSVIREYSFDTSCDFDYRFMDSKDGNSTTPAVYLNFDAQSEDFVNYKRSVGTRLVFNRLAQCQSLLKFISLNIESVRNFLPFWRAKWGEVIGIVDYVDPIQSAIRTWNLPFAVVPCRLKWSNKMMIVLPDLPDDDSDNRDDTGRCLKFTIATDGEVFVVIATTPSNQLTWYTLHITTKGVIFYRVCDV